MIPVTKPFLPPIEEYKEWIDGIWSRQWLTNHGPLVNELELQLKDYLGLPHLLFLSNGTVALQIAIKALDLKGEIITTPFSYVATTSSIVWEGCVPVFADIDADTLNIDVNKIEALVTEKTSAILATHVFGNPCDVSKINELAKKFNLKVIYDAAHCFGTKYKKRSIFDFGDISTASFHATKVFHTIEGGAVFSTSADLLKKMALLRNFGHTSPVEFDGMGINGKNSEFHAAMGLCNLKYIDAILEKRKKLFEHYDSKLRGYRCRRQKITEDSYYNYSYYPIIFEKEEDLLKTTEQLKLYNIYPRRYFCPSLNKLNYVTFNSCPVSENVSNKILCLPLYHSLSSEEQDMICRILLRVQNN